MDRRVDESVNDAGRLASLRATGLLDTDSEDSFDRLTRLGAQILRAPVSLVSLVDRDRQFFKSAVGLEEPWKSRRQTPLEYSFCRFAVASNEPFIVRDARGDPRVAESPSIPELGVVAYAGVPLTASDGYVLGAFCVIDHQPRDWTASEIEVLQGLAAATMAEINLRQTRRELDLQERRFRSLVQNAPDIAAILEGDGVIRYVSPAVQRILGREPDEAQGGNVFDMIHPAERDGLRERYSDMLQHPGPQLPIGLRIQHADGRWVDLEVALSNMLNEESIRGVVANARDVTERNHSLALSRESSHRLTTLVETTASGLMVLDHEGRITIVNRAAEVILGLDREAIVQLGFGHLPWTRTTSPSSPPSSHPWEPETIGDTRAVLKDIELSIEHRDGSKTFVSLTATPLSQDDEYQGLIVTFSDVTARNRTEDELRLLNDVKSRFVSIVSHEFRTALTGIQGFSQLIRDEAFPLHTIKEYANDINEDAQRLNRMISDMLDLDRIESGEMGLNREPFELDALLSTIVRKWQVSTHRDIVLDLPGHAIWVTADRDKITQSIANLLSNSVKYSTGTITVALSQLASVATVAVSDIGLGIPRHELESIFDRYIRTASSERGGSVGTGLGLSLVRQIARMHGGNAWAESTLGKGSTCFFAISTQ